MSSKGLPKGISQRPDGRYMARFQYKGEKYCLYDYNIERLQEKMWTIVNKKDTIFKYIFWERLDSLPIPEGCFHFIWCQIS